MPKKEPHSRMKISRSKKEPHRRMKISMLEKEPHGLVNNWSFILFVIYWEVRLKPPNIALSLVLHWLPRKGRDRLVFVLWACSCSARRWLDLPGPGFVVIHRPAQMPRVQAPHYITLHYTNLWQSFENFHFKETGKGFSIDQTTTTYFILNWWNNHSYFHIYIHKALYSFGRPQRPSQVPEFLVLPVFS